jgi:hypothetical protein
VVIGMYVECWKLSEDVVRMFVCGSSGWGRRYSANSPYVMRRYEMYTNL